MKSILLFFALLTGISCSVAQVVRIDTLTYPVPSVPKAKRNNFNIDYWYTVAVRTYGYEQFPQVLNQADQLFLSSYFNGVLLKYNDNQIGYRLQGSYFDRDISFDNKCEGCERADGRFQNTTIKLGIEKSINYARLQPYLGADIGFMAQKFKGSSVKYATAEEIYTEDIKNAALLSPFIGVKLYLTSRVAVAGEANFNMAYTYQKSNAYPDETRTAPPYQTKRYKWEYFFAPVGSISLQYSFGLINQ